MVLLDDYITPHLLFTTKKVSHIIVIDIIDITYCIVTIQLMAPTNLIFYSFLSEYNVGTYWVLYPLMA